MVWPAGGDESFRCGASRIDFRGRYLESYRRCDENRALVLLSHGGSESALLPADRLHDRRAAAVEYVGAALHAAGQRAPHDGAISRWSAGSSGAFPAISFSAAEVVGKHGCAPCRLSGWANAGERWPVVSDGVGAQTLSVAGGIALRDDRVRNGAFDGSGVLDCSRDALPLLAAVSAAAGLPGDATACVSDDSVGGHSDESAFCCVASASPGRHPFAQVEKHPTNDIGNHARGTDDGVHPFSLFSWREPGIALRQEHGRGGIAGRCETLGGNGLSIGGLPSLRGFDGGNALNASSRRSGMDGRDGGENIWRAAESDEFAVRARVPGFSDQCKTVARKP